MKVAEIIATGMGIAFQDQGRPGWRRFGVPPGGAMDLGSAQLANELLHNHPNDTVLELTMHGAVLKFHCDTWLAITGAGSTAEFQAHSARMVHAGEVLKFLPTPDGLWTYLAIPGGWHAAQWFGSSSYYLRGNLGSPINVGTILESTTNRCRPFAKSIATRILSPENRLEMTPPPTGFPIYPGPQFDQFPEKSRQQLVNETWRISPQSDRTGFRLEGMALALAPDITSEAVLPGSFQVPGTGQPIITMPDGPTVGGYPKMAWMEPATLWRLAQCPPGSHISFQWIK